MTLRAHQRDRALAVLGHPFLLPDRCRIPDTSMGFRSFSRRLSVGSMSAEAAVVEWVMATSAATGGAAEVGKGEGGGLTLAAVAGAAEVLVGIGILMAGGAEAGEVVAHTAPHRGGTWTALRCLGRISETWSLLRRTFTLKILL